jgi:hypothetical protein
VKRKLKYQGGSASPEKMKNFCGFYKINLGPDSYNSSQNPTRTIKKIAYGTYLKLISRPFAAE